MKAIAFALLLACAASVPALAKDAFTQRADVRAFIRDMAERHAFVESELQFLFARTRRMESVLKAITPPKDPRARSWRAYRGRFVNEARIGEGLDFWRRHEAALSRAAEAHGVPEEIIVSIIGVETLYGRNAGSFRVIDALATLAFLYPPRATYFRSELEQYLLFTRDAGLDVFSVKGSYAGAIGIPQFMPGSYLRYAVDFDGDGRRDLVNNVVDAIGSVGNFLSEHGWQRNEPVTFPVTVNGDAHQLPLSAGIEPRFRIGELDQYGIALNESVDEDLLCALIEFETPNKPSEFWIGLKNFYVITRYNQSSFYAMSVNALAESIKTKMTPPEQRSAQ